MFRSAGIPGTLDPTQPQKPNLVEKLKLLTASATLILLLASFITIMYGRGCLILTDGLLLSSIGSFIVLRFLKH